MNSVFPTRLKQQRLAKKLTQQDVVDLVNNLDDTINLSRNSISRYENGTRIPNINILSAIAYVLDIDTDYLIGKSEKKNIFYTNNSLQSFCELVEEICNYDNAEVNDELSHMIDNFRNIISLANKHNNFNELKSITDNICHLLNYASNANKNYIITDTKKLLQDKIIIEFEKSSIEEAEKYIPQIIKYIEVVGPKDLSDTDIEILDRYYHRFDPSKIPTIIKEILKSTPNDKLKWSRDNSFYR